MKEIIGFAHGNSSSELVGDDDTYCRMIIDIYSNDYLKKVFDSKYGSGSCDYITEAFRYYSQKKPLFANRHE